jgi:hypothetical protein
MGERKEGMEHLAKGIALDPDYLESHHKYMAVYNSMEFDLAEMNFSYAELFAAIGNIEKTVDYLKRAKRAGFNAWNKILKEKEFDKVRDDPRIREFLF